MDVAHHEQPERYHEVLQVKIKNMLIFKFFLIFSKFQIHGKLDPLVNVNLTPDTHVKVQVK